MINILVTKGHSYKIRARGHAGDEYGKDIVCSAVSSLFQNILVGLESLNIDWNYDLKDGAVDITLSRKYSEDMDKAFFLVDTTIKSLKEIRDNYSDKINIEEKSINEIV